MRKIAFLLFIMVACVFVFSCDNSGQKFEFFYYPSQNVYYDVANKMYLYSLDGGKNWDSLSVSSNKEPATLGAKQIIYSTTPQVWLDNNQHIQQYNGKLINIVLSDSAYNEEKLAADRKIKKSKAVTTSTAEPEKKPGFFKRLFGKKNKN